jgi:deoxyribonuclease-4
MTKRKVGFHVSIAGGIANAVDNAKRLGCSAFQIFSRNPRGWIAKPLNSDDVKLFRKKLAESEIDSRSVAVHMPYLPNLSGPPGDFYRKSRETLAEEIRRCVALEIPYLVIHLGSHMGTGTDSGISQLATAVDSALEVSERANPDMTVLLENNAGQKNSVGGSFEELWTLLDRLSNRRGQVGLCLDTCHLFASGYDISTKRGVENILTKLDRIVGINHVSLVHLNDSKGLLGSNLDRHEHVGLGYIGRAGLSAFLNHHWLKELPFIMETPIDDKRGDKENLLAVKKMIR